MGDLAVCGDAIEDVYRIDLTGPGELRIDLAAVDAGQNLEVHAVTEDLRLINPTHEGTSQTGVERSCLDLEAGAYYLMVSNFDLTTSQDEPYDLSVASDLQSISVTIEDDASEVEVTSNCESTVNFTLELHDNCCQEPDILDQLVITPSIPTSNASHGAAIIDDVEVISEWDIVVSGHIVVSALTSCPAELHIDAAWQDCSGNTVDTTVDGGSDTIDVIDTTAPEVESSVELSGLWAPDHDLEDVGFTSSATDNCDAGVANALQTTVWSDDSETREAADGVFAPDVAVSQDMLRLRAERMEPGEGRVYLITTGASDACGNSTVSCSAVAVPANSSPKAVTSIDSQEQAALDYCASNAAAPADFVQHGLADEVGPKQ